MRLYRIENMVFTETSYEELLEIQVLIVPESALSEYEFQACEYIGDLAGEFDVQRKETPEEDPNKGKGKVVKIKKD